MAEPHRHVAVETDAHAGNTAHLDALEESVNKRIDADVNVLMENMKEILNLSRVRPPHPGSDADRRERSLRR